MWTGQQTHPTSRRGSNPTVHLRVVPIRIGAVRLPMAMWLGADQDRHDYPNVVCPDTFHCSLVFGCCQAATPRGAQKFLRVAAGGAALRLAPERAQNLL